MPSLLLFTGVVPWDSPISLVDVSTDFGTESSTILVFAAQTFMRLPQ